MAYDFRQPRQQPAYTVLRNQARNLSAVARVIGVSEYELRDAVSGKVRPSIDVREKLPLFLQVPLVDLFEPELLAVVPRRRQRRPKVPEPVP